MAAAQENMVGAMPLKKALEGAAATGAETELIHLSDLKFKGCSHCFECKRIRSQTYGTCAITDDLTPVLKKIREADVMFFGSPMTFGKISSSLQNFFERIMQPENTNEPYHATMWPRKTRTVLYLSTDMSRQEFAKTGFAYQATAVTRRIFREFRVQIFTDALMFRNGYDNYYSLQYDENQRRAYHDGPFALELEKVRQDARERTWLPPELENPYRDRHIQWLRKNVPGAHF